MPATTTNRPLRAALAGLALSTALAGAAGAQSGLPPGVYAGEHDAALAPAGAYALDPDHTAVVARVSHIGYSYSLFRFGKAQGSLTWDPKAPTKSQVAMTVMTGSIATPVAGFAAELSGDGYLKAKAYPKATFVSTAFHRIDASHGRVDGKFTLMGKTRPVSASVALVGAGKGYMSHPRIGVHVETTIKTADYGLPAVLGPTIALVIDTEFART